MMQKVKAINWKPIAIILARVSLAIIGATIYFVRAFFKSFLGILCTVFSLADSYAFKYSNAKYFNHAQKWSNRTARMLWRGLWKCFLFTFTGGNTDLLKAFWFQTSEPLIEFAYQLWKG